MRIAFCDDDSRLTDLLRSYAKAWASSTNTTLDCKDFNSSDEFLLSWTSPIMFDVIFLDIKMKPLSGLELARVIRSISSQVSIVFITAYSEYALDGYSVDATSYLLKPVSQEVFFECMDRLVNKLTLTGRKPFFFESGGTTIKLHYNEIIYFEARSHTIVVHTLTDKIKFRARISDLEQMLDHEDEFSRIHRSFIVNLTQIREMNKSEVLMENGDRLPVSRSYAREAHNEYIKYSSKHT